MSKGCPDDCDGESITVDPVEGFGFAITDHALHGNPTGGRIASMLNEDNANEAAGKAHWRKKK